MIKIGIRREDKNRWERRVPLVPEDVKDLIKNYSIDVVVQSSNIRVFKDAEYTKIGAKVSESLSSCNIIFAIKEIPSHLFEPEKTYIFFSHTTKGQPHNMPMLKRMIELGCQLIDYEKIVDENGKRLLAFGRFAGIAGMIDSLWALGKRLDWEGIPNPFSEIKQTIAYESLEDAKRAVSCVGEKIKNQGIHNSLCPFICGFSGYGNVSKGAQEIFDYLPVKEVTPESLSSVFDSPSCNLLYKVVFKEEDMVEPINSDQCFVLQDYYAHPEKYKARFHSYLPYLTMVINGIYWEEKYPRLITKEHLKKLYANKPRLRIIGDITCDIEGSIECTLRYTLPDNPVYVYNPFEDHIINGFEGLGPVVLAVDNLPAELPLESSIYFSKRLKPFVPEIAKANYKVSFEECELSSSIKNAMILYQGKLTPRYKYLEKFL